MMNLSGDPFGEGTHSRSLDDSSVAYRDFSERLIDASTREEVAEVAIESAARMTGAEAVALLVTEKPEDPAAVPWEYSAAGSVWAGLPQDTRRGVMAAAVREAAILVEADAADFLSRQGLPQAASLCNLIAVPLEAGPGCAGAVVACNLASTGELSYRGVELSSLALLVSHAIDRVRLSEARDRQTRLLQTIVESTRSHIAYLDRDFNFVLVNSAYEQGCGHSRSELLGRNHFSFFPNPENELIFQRTRDTGEPMEAHEKAFEYADQPERGVTYWDWTLIPVTNERGVVEGLLLSLTDLTEHVRTRQRLVDTERARARLAETLAAEVGHRMRNSLAMVSSMLRMQIADLKDDSASARILRQTISRIHSIAAVHDQMWERADENVVLRDAIRRLVEAAREALSLADVTVTVEGRDTSYPSGIATPVCVIVNELVTNAMKHGAPAADGKLHIAVTVDSQQGELRLSVWNSGNPVPADFDPSKQSGAGLRLVHDMTVRHYSGSLSVQPHEGGTLAEMVFDDATLRRTAQH